MAAIREVVQTHPYIAMDTEFPGIVARPVGDFSQNDYQYQTLRCNVDLLKIIQLGLRYVWLLHGRISLIKLSVSCALGLTLHLAPLQFCE
jgi:hypothetical protein